MSSRLALARVLPLLLLPVLYVACGPAAIGVAVGSSGGGGGGGGGGAPLAPLTLEATEDVGTLPAGRCGLIRTLRVSVNRPNARLTYRLNDGPELSFTDPLNGEPTPEPTAGVVALRQLLVRPGTNTVVVKASVGSEEAQQTVPVEAASDPLVVAIEPPDVQGTTMRLRWSMPDSEATFFWVFFDDTPGAIDELTGAAAQGSSPLRVAVADLQPETVGTRTYYSFTLDDLAAEADGRLRYHHFAVRSNDGCESRVVTAHTRPAARVKTWPAGNRTVLELTTPGGTPAAAPVGGIASSDDVVGMPALAVDRGADGTNDPTITAPDGRPDAAFVDRDTRIYVAASDALGLRAPVLVDDAISTAGTCPGVPVTASPEPIRAFSFDNDLDTRPDLFLLTVDRLWVYFGVKSNESGSSTPTPGEQDLLNFKKDCDSYIDYATLPGVPWDGQFLDAYYGDFDGDGTTDLAASVGKPQTSTEPGQTDRIFVWYQDRGLGNEVDWNWPNVTPDTIDVSTAFGDDGYFVVGDVDGDGRDDLCTLHHDDAENATFRIWLMRGRAGTPVLVESASVDPRVEIARWDQRHLVDVDYDGDLDVVGLQSFFNGVATAVRLTAYLVDVDAGTIQSDLPYLSSELRRTHATAFPDAPRQRGHLQLRDVDGDGVVDAVLRTITDGSEYDSSLCVVYAGVRDPVTGRQNWQVFDETPTQIDFALGAQEVPHVHFMAADLDQDGLDEFSAVHETPSTPPQLVTMHGGATWSWERFPATPGADRYRLAGTSPLDGVATGLRATRLARDGDIVLDAGAGGVLVWPARADAGQPNGAFDRPTLHPLTGPLPIDVLAYDVPQRPAPSGDVLLLGTDGTIGNLEPQGDGTFAWRSETNVASATSVYTAMFDYDERADALVVDANATLHLLSTVDATGGRNRDLAVVDTLTLERAPELVLVTSVSRDAIDEVIVVLSPESGLETRLVRKYRVRIADATGTASFDTTPDEVTFPTELVSLSAANHRGRAGNNLEQRKWLVAGTADGRVLVARNNDATAIPVPPGIGPIGTGRVHVLSVDVTNDSLPDIVAYHEGDSRLAILRVQPDAATPDRFPNPGGFVFQAAGLFDNPVFVDLPEPLSMLAARRVNDDPFADLLALSADGQRVHVIVTAGQQLAP